MSKKFKRQSWWRFKRLDESWRRPRGKDSKMRLQIKGKPPLVSVGYRSPKSERGLHPCGLKEVLVHSLKDLEKIDPATQAVRISSTVGKRLKTQILKAAQERKIKILNPGV